MLLRALRKWVIIEKFRPDRGIRRALFTQTRRRGQAVENSLGGRFHPKSDPIGTKHAAFGAL